MHLGNPPMPSATPRLRGSDARCRPVGPRLRPVTRERRRNGRLGIMIDQNPRERMLFTFQSNGEIHGQRLVEATAEHLLIHEAPVGPNAETQLK